MGHNGLVNHDDDIPATEPSRRDAERARDAQWVGQAVAGDRDAFGRLYDVWFDRAFNLALRVTRQREVAQEVAQDAFLSAWRNLAGLEDPGSFGGWLLRITRNGALNRAGREARSRPVDDEGMAVIVGAGASPASAPRGFGAESRLARAEDPEVAVGDAEVASLVREAVRALGERDAEVLDLQLRYDLTPAEIGEVIGINRNAANQLCHRVRGRFATAFGARMLWSGARPACPGLQAALASAGVDSFGADAVKLADRHAQGCATCDERRQLRLQPGALFAALPLLAVPALVKAQVAAALASADVPMAGSASAVPTSSPPTWASVSGPPAEPPAPPGPPAPPDPAPAAGAPDPDPKPTSSSLSIGRRLALAGATALVVVVLVALLVVNRPGDGGQVALSGTSTSGAPTTSGPGVDTTTGPGSDAPGRGAPGGGADPGPGGSDAPAPGDPSGQPAGTTSTTSSSTTTSTTTTTAPAAVVELLSLAPADPQPTTYPLTRGAPVLSWRVSGATSVQVWVAFDDGSGGPTTVQLVSTEPSGEQWACPGTLTTPTTCTAAAGWYSYVVEATNLAGATVASDRGAPPGFQVFPIIG